MISQPKLFAAGLPPEIDEEIFVKQIERIDKSIQLKSVVILRDNQTMRSKGLAILEFFQEKDCKYIYNSIGEKALKRLNYIDLFGNELHLSLFRPGGIRDKTTGNLFVRGLPEDCRSADLHQLFENCGKISSCKVKYNPNGKCKGYGYVQYESKEEADKAIIEMNNKPYKNGKLLVESFKNSGSRTASFMNYNNLFVKNVPKSFSDKDIIDLFKPYGEIISAVVIKEHPDASLNKGFGFVCFKKAEDAKNAEMKLNNLVIEGKNLYICRALPKDEHRRKLREERYKTFKDCNLYVKELPEDINNDKLKEAFSEFGKVVSAIVMLEKRQDLFTGKTEMKSKGFGFVCFNNKQEASKALMASTKQPILGRMLYVAITEKKEDRAARMSALHFFGPRPPLTFPYAFPPQPRKQQYVFSLLINRLSIECIDHR